MRKLTVLAVMAVSSMIAFAQSAPIKMGLWEKKMTMDMGTGAPQNINSKSCITPETWQEMVGEMDKTHEGCTIDKKKSDHGYTFTVTCKTSTGGTMVTRGNTTMQDSEHIISQTHSTMTKDGKSRNMESKSTSTYLGSDCGAVKPCEPEVEDN